jgi:hypothetical protein
MHGLALCLLCGMIPHACEAAPARGQFALLAAQSGSPDAIMNAIIENVQANEALYENLEIVSSKTYRLIDGAMAPQNAAATIFGQSRIVYQHGLLFIKHDENLKGADGKQYDQGFLEGYDGKSTRVVEQGRVANIRNDKLDELRLIRPHCLAIQSQVPLSVFLRGGEGMRKHPWYRNASITSRYVRDEMCFGLRCHKVRIDLTPDSWKPTDGTHYWFQNLWLAIDRNFLPIRSEGYLDIQKDGESPIEIGVADDLREIAPGVWFPFRARIDSYDRISYRDQGKHSLMGTHDIHISQASLDPNYDISLFRDIPIPNGAQVHIIENGVTVRSYTQGGRNVIKPRPFPWQWPAIGIVLVGTLTAGGYMRYRRGCKDG